MVMFTIIPVVLLYPVSDLFEVLGILKPFFKEGFKPPEARTFFNVFIKDSYYTISIRPIYGHVVNLLLLFYKREGTPMFFNN